MTAVTDVLRGQIVVTLPTAASFAVPIDRIQIARMRGTLSGAPPTITVPDDIAATVPATQTTWIDRLPYANANTYFYRGRVAADPDAWTVWTNADAADVPARALRDELTSPFTCLEISNAEDTDVPLPLLKPTKPYLPAVESAPPIRFAPSADTSFELNIEFRAFHTINPAIGSFFNFGFRWFDAAGNWLSETVKSTQLVLSTDGQPIGGGRSLTATPPTSASKFVIFFELTGDDVTPIKIRIENVVLYQKDPTLDSTWEYIQVPDDDGLTPDSRPSRMCRSRRPGWRRG